MNTLERRGRRHAAEHLVSNIGSATDAAGGGAAPHPLVCRRRDRADWLDVMQTQLMHEPAVGQPWLEYYPTDGGPPEQVPLEQTPFSIGRNESTNLPLQSTRVSREHAVIVVEGDTYRVKDLGSTNGTFLNGQRVHEAPLSDGDILLVADVEFNFFCGHSRFPRGAATQVMQLADDLGASCDPGVEMIREVRRLHEALMHRGVESLFQPLVDLETGKVVGYEAITEDLRELHMPAARQAVLALDCRLTARLRQMRRIVAVEEAAVLPGELDVFVSLHSSEIGAAGLVESVGRLRGALSPGQRLVVRMPESAVSDSPYACRLRHQMREMGIGISQDGSSASELDAGRTAEVRPDFLELAPTLSSGIDQNPQRKRQVEAVVASARKLGCQIIATGIQTQPEAEACRQLGCRLAQGDFYGCPKPLHAWLNAGSHSTGTGLRLRKT